MHQLIECLAVEKSFVCHYALLNFLIVSQVFLKEAANEVAPWNVDEGTFENKKISADFLKIVSSARKLVFRPVYHIASISPHNAGTVYKIRDMSSSSAAPVSVVDFLSTSDYLLINLLVLARCKNKTAGMLSLKIQLAFLPETPL